MRVAWGQALASLRCRPGRNIVSGISIALAVAFYVYVRTQTAGEASSDRSTFLLAAACLLAFVGILNTMFLTVAERFREIGTLKCLGASDGLVLGIVLLEAAVLAVVSSCAGVALAAFVLQGGIGRAAAEGLVVGVGLTLGSALVPAMLAARVPASHALRVDP